MTIAVGDAFPTSVKLQKDNPHDEVDLATVLPGKKVIIFGVPGAFTPTCSNSHLPSYLRDYEKIKAKGVDTIICISVNDAFVMAAWGKAQNTAGKVVMLADPAAELTKAIGLDVDAKPLGRVACKRFSALIVDGKITQLNVEPDGFGATCSLADKLNLD